MSRRATVPSYRLHKPTGQAVVTVPLPGGGRKDIYLGKWGTKQSRSEYARVIAELHTAPDPATVGTPGTRSDLSVNELLLAFMQQAEESYRSPDGRPTSELAEFRLSFRVLKHPYGHTPARQFGPLALRAVRDQFVAGGLSRGEVNRRTRAVRRLFKWAVGRELVPPGVLQALHAVEGLRKGRSPAPDPDPVRPVAEADVAATLPFLPTPVRAMVEVQRLTGMRPGEVCGLRPADIDRSGPVWVYRPPHHKTAHAGKDRAVPIGPQAQAVLAPLTPADPAAYYFDPRVAVAEERAARSARRVTPRSASPARRAAGRVAAPKRAAGPKYATGSYGRAVARGVTKANAARRAAAERSGGTFVPVLHWQPNQLRHAHATQVRRLFGVEAAQVLLGHARADVTQVYAERDLSLAVKVAGEIG